MIASNSASQFLNRDLENPVGSMELFMMLFFWVPCGFIDLKHILHACLYRISKWGLCEFLRLLKEI